MRALAYVSEDLRQGGDQGPQVNSASLTIASPDWAVDLLDFFFLALMSITTIHHL